MEIDTFTLDLDRCIVCGLTINELVSNAMKYALAGMTDGHLKISFFNGNDNAANLIVTDNKTINSL